MLHLVLKYQRVYLASCFEQIRAGRSFHRPSFHLALTPCRLLGFDCASCEKADGSSETSRTLQLSKHGKHWWKLWIILTTSHHQLRWKGYCVSFSSAFTSATNLLRALPNTQCNDDGCAAWNTHMCANRTTYLKLLPRFSYNRRCCVTRCVSDYWQ